MLRLSTVDYLPAGVDTPFLPVWLPAGAALSATACAMGWCESRSAQR
ncbi:hypothetical protein FBY35_5846 [Streptomyces sp. SLBN-118]|nr:hypothetical protein FBY35_5846 [Streptomyces sp. SLBN-118]